MSAQSLNAFATQSGFAQTLLGLLTDGILIPARQSYCIGDIQVECSVSL